MDKARIEGMEREINRLKRWWMVGMEEHPGAWALNARVVYGTMWDEREWEIADRWRLMVVMDGRVMMDEGVYLWKAEKVEE